MNIQKLELKRAIYHCFSVSMVVALSYIVPYELGLKLLISALILYVVIDLIRAFHPKYGDTINKYMTWYLRPKEEKGRSANIDCIMGMIFAYALFPLPIFRAVILTVAISDPLARIFGISFGKRHLPGFLSKKTWIGSSTFFISSFICCLFFIDPYIAAIGALMATFAEMLPEFKYWLNDNFNIPAISGLTMIFVQTLI